MIHSGYEDGHVTQPSKNKGLNPLTQTYLAFFLHVLWNFFGGGI